MDLSGVGILGVPQPSKLMRQVRFLYPAPNLCGIPLIVARPILPGWEWEFEPLIPLHKEGRVPMVKILGFGPGDSGSIPDAPAKSYGTR